ncbi:MAG: AAA family ATPase [Thermoleophilaceae bacterium]|nr:AAA family ATPase [Thermoleophilaceae bacterium]
MSDSPRYITLRDYVRVLRAHRLLIVLMTLVFGAAGYATAAWEKPVYASQATIVFRAANADTGLVSPDGSPSPAQDIRPSVAAQLVKRPALSEAVKNSLGSSLSVGELRAKVSGRVDPRTNLLIVETRDGDAKFAALLADGYADEIVLRATRAERKRYAVAAKSLERRLKTLGKDDLLAQANLRSRFAQLEALRDFAEPVDSLERSDVPSTPISPKPVRTTLLGLLVGFTLGILAAFLREAFDRRLRSAGDIEERLDLPLLGHVTDDALGRNPIAQNGRKELTPLDIEAFRILRANLEFLHGDTPVKSLAVTSGLPEEGKTTVALALTSVNAVAGKKTLLIECDLRRPSLASRLEIESKPGLTDYLTGQAEPSEVIRTVEVGRAMAAPGTSASESAEAAFACIPAGSQIPFPAEALRSTRFRGLLEEVSEVYDAVILDTAPLLSVVDTRELIPLVDGLLLCVRSKKTTDGEAVAAKDALGRFPDRPTALVVTGLRRGEDSEYGYYGYSYSYGSQPG